MSLLCPTCQTDLVMADRQGVEIDYCPKCRGVWLDRGELDKIIERAMPAPGAARGAQPSTRADRQEHEPRHDRIKGDERRSRNWLSDIFD